MDLEEERRQSRERRRAQGEPVPDYEHEEEPVPDNATAGAIAARRVRAAEGYVRHVRETLFGSPEPPFHSRADPACQRWEMENLTSGDGTLEEAVAAVARGTGFKEFAVHVWALTGQPPRLPRVLLRTQGRKEQLPDGTVLRREWATITVNAPVKEAEIRKAWRRLNAAWVDSTLDVMATLNGARRRRTPRITESDKALIALVDRMPEATWKERADVWAGEHEAVKPDTLSRRYRRAMKRLNSLDPQEEDTNA